MNRVTLWYKDLGKSSRVLVIVACVVVVVVVVGAIGYMVFNPKKVEVKYGTIVRDPVDGHVWEDKTKTAWVNPSQAGNYEVEYIDKLSPEHEKQQAEQQAQQQQQQQQQAQGPTMELMQAPMNSSQMNQINTLQQNIKSAGQSVMSGLEMAGKISDTKTSLVNYRNQVAGIAVAPELEGKKQQILRAFDLYIQACDLYLQGIANSSMASMQQANNLINQANALMRSLIPTH